MSLGSEIGHAARRLARRPLLALTAISILAIGIGANSAIFSLLEAVVLRPLPVPDPGRLVYLREIDSDGTTSQIGFQTYLDIAARDRELASVAVSAIRQPTLAGSDSARTLDALAVSASWLPTLGLEPALGRNFTAAEDRPGAPRVALLGNALWRSQFAGDAKIVGRTVELNDVPYEIVGVLPPTLDRLLGPGAGRRLDLVVPLRYDVSQAWTCRDCRHLTALARVRPASTLAAARAELDVTMAALRAAWPDKYPTARAVLLPMDRQLTASSRPLLTALLAGVGLVLLLAAANVAALLAVRALERGRDLAIRRALGADRRRLLFDAFAESALLAAGGALAGLALARPLLDLLVASAPAYLPRLDGVGLSLPVLAFTSAIALAVAAAAGAAPAIVHWRTSPRAALAAGTSAGPGRERRRQLGALVVAELALALVVVFSALLLGRSLENLMREDTGFRPEGAVVADVSANGAHFEDDARVNAFFDHALERVAALPGVTAAGWMSQLPLGGNFDRYTLRFEDKPAMRLDEEPAADRYAVTPGAFAALGVRLVAGRFLADSDRQGTELVAVVSRRLADRMWPEEGALGKRVQLGGKDAPWRTIVGVVEDVLHQGLDQPSAAQCWVPVAQWFFADSSRTLVVRSTQPAAQLARPIAAAIRAVDPNRPVEHFAAMTDVVARSAAGRRYAATLWSAFALLALLLAAIGTFGLLARQVAMRRRELAVRSALGAAPSRLAGELGLQAARWILAALALALPALWAVGRLLASQLWKVPAGDPLTFVVAFLVVATMATAASLSPARRAARVDPATVLRDE